MKWNKYTIHTTEDAEDAVIAMLCGLGYDSVEIEDRRPVTPEESGGLFGDVVPEMPEDDGSAAVIFYTEDRADRGAVLESVREALGNLRKTMEIGSGEVTVSTTVEEDWINNWKEHFHSFFVDDILIEPTWEETEPEPGEASMVLHIDPGTAFGTGAHESTKLAIRALRKYLKPGDRVLDIGTGSGILGIIALKSGASRVFGTDIDDNAFPAIAENLEVNAVSESDFVTVLGNIADSPVLQEQIGFGCYDIAVANIIAEILAEITPAIPAHLKEGGIYITSGILTDREDVMLEAAEKVGFEVIETERMGEWSSIVFRKGSA